MSRSPSRNRWNSSNSIFVRSTSDLAGSARCVHLTPPETGLSLRWNQAHSTLTSGFGEVSGLIQTRPQGISIAVSKASLIGLVAASRSIRHPSSRKTNSGVFTTVLHTRNSSRKSIHRASSAVCIRRRFLGIDSLLEQC